MMMTLAAVLVLVVGAGCDTHKPLPKLEVTPMWMAVPGRPHCNQHRLRLDVATVSFTMVSARGATAKADERGHATLELSRAQVASHDRLRVSIPGGKAEFVVPERPRDAQPIELGIDPEPAAGAMVAWRGAATGAVLGGRLAVVGVIDGDTLRFRFVGCDLKGGIMTGGSVVAVRFASPYELALPDAIDVRVPLAARVAATTAPTADPLTFTVDNADDVRGQVTLTGTLDVAAAQAALAPPAVARPAP